jgi:hypothetical protein
MYVNNIIFSSIPCKDINGKAICEGSMISIKPLIISGIRGSPEYETM